MAETEPEPFVSNDEVWTEDGNDMQVEETPNKDRMVVPTSPTITDDFKSKCLEAQKGDSATEFIGVYNQTSKQDEIFKTLTKFGESVNISELWKPREQRADGPSLGDQLSQILGPVGVPCLALLLAVLAFSPQFSQLILVVGVCAGFMYLVKTWQRNVTVKSEEAIDQHRTNALCTLRNTSAALTETMASHADKIHSDVQNTVRKLADNRNELQSEMLKTIERVKGVEIEADLKKKLIEEEHANERYKTSNETKLAVEETQARGREKVEEIKAKREIGKTTAELEMNKENNKTKLEIQRNDQQTKEKIAQLENDATLKKEQIHAGVNEIKIAADKEVAIETERESTKQATIRWNAEVRKEEEQAQVEVHRADARVKEIEASKSSCVVS